MVAGARIGGKDLSRDALPPPFGDGLGLGANSVDVA